MKEFKVIGWEEVWSLDSGGNFDKKNGRYIEFLRNGWMEREGNCNTTDSGLCIAHQ